MLQTPALRSGSQILEDVSQLKFEFHRHENASNLTQEIAFLFSNSGKRFRPALVYLFGELFGLDRTHLETYAKAVEVTHTASLIHDDVIDESIERRKNPTLNATFTNTQAILAGDYLLAHVIGELLKTSTPEITFDLTDAIKNLADGEWLQAKLKTQGSASWVELEEVARKKTGSLMKWSCLAPAKLAQKPHEIQDVCARMGDDIGLFFQMLDDVNDFNTKSGKPFGADIINGQQNFVTSHLLSHSPQFAQELRHFKQTGEMTILAEIEKSRKVVVEKSLELERDLNARFASLTTSDSDHLKKVFAKMLEKVREAFTPS
ncbi:MAG: polyprenyl synthetase family protein [Proteobacteria bacterium]|jgi:octaprenyl-diphosphate synthase|nr:polyprenyl synthetase family protein [Pseudomonadota bacterium]